ncbi:MAG: glycosyltransferase [Planctomycetota bacterium]
MRKVLFIAYYFPPMGGPGTQRSAKFVKYLPEFGWEPIVVTARREDYEVAREFQLDSDLDAEMRDIRVRVHQVSGGRGVRLAAWAKGKGLFPFLWFLDYRDFWEPQVFWARRAAARCLEIARAERIDAVYTSMGPFSSALAGREVKLRASIPWVADLRDLWTEGELRVWPSRLHYEWEKRLERRLLSAADGILANTELSRVRLLENVGVPPERVRVIPNGFDAGDFEGMTRERGREQFVIAHVGAFRDHTKGPGQPRWPLYAPVVGDERARSPLYVLEAVRGLLADHPRIGEKLRIRLVGYLSPKNGELVEEMGLGEIVQATGYLEHAAGVREIMNADALLLVLGVFADARRAVPLVPGKVYEYLAGGKPILAALPPGDAKRIVEESGAGFLAPHNDPEKIRETIERMYGMWEKGALDAAPRKEFVARFERRRQAGDLARFLDERVRGREGRQ